MKTISPSSQELEQLIATFQGQLAAAETDAEAASAALTAQLAALTAANDKAGIARLRKSLKVAQDRSAELRDDIKRTEVTLAKARQDESLAADLAKWSSFRDAAMEVNELALVLEEQIQKTVDAAKTFESKRKAAYDLCPWRPPTPELSSPLFDGHAAARMIEMELHVRSEAYFLKGRFGQSPWELRQAPGFAARVRENISRSFSHAPRVPPEDFPDEAA